MTPNLAYAWKLALAWILSLAVVGAIASGLSAQTAPPVPLTRPLITEGTTILSGSDIGFRVERIQDGIPIGTLVVRVDGRWVDAAARETPAK